MRHTFRHALLIAWIALAAGCARPQRWEQVALHHPADLPADSALAAPPAWRGESDHYDWHRDYADGQPARAGDGFDLAMRNPDFPRTHIAVVHVDLTSPDHAVRIVWAGPLTAQGPTGPWRSSPGRGSPGFNCDNVAASNRTDSNCTPKGVFRVKGFADRLATVPGCTYATWVIHHPRFIAMHYSDDIPSIPASGGCIRLPYEAAKLIHNNALTGVTLIHIYGTWTGDRSGIARP